MARPGTARDGGVVVADQRAAGFTAAGRGESGTVWLSATISTPKQRDRIVAVNELHPPPGLSLYTPRWGARTLPARNAPGRYISPTARTARMASYHNVRSRGVLLVAKGAAARRTLAAIGTGTRVSIHARIRPRARQAFLQAYGVGAKLVSRGHAKRGFTCRSANTKQPARTAIGFANGGRTLLLAVVADHPHTSLHGLDNDQMAKLMAQLGADRAFDFDGSGSSEVLARLPRTRRLSLRNYPADGAERPMPMGIGIYGKR